MYREIYKEYGKRLKETEPDVIFVSKKWCDNDLIWPFSDLDFRIIVEDKSIDFYEFNMALFHLQKRLIKKDYKTMKRILEHPPGYMFKKSELLYNYLEDINNWSFCYGDEKIFSEIKNMNTNKNKFDANYYMRIINKRYKKFSLDTEYEYEDAKLNKCFQNYCVLWHYYLPCIYALNSLESNIPQGNKTANISSIKNKTICSVYNYIANNNHNELIRYDYLDLSKIVEDEIKPRIKNLKPKKVISEQYLEAIAMFRTRIARYLLYLDNIKSDKDYLIKREINELRFIIFEIYKKHDDYIMKELYEHINSSNDAKKIIEYVLLYLRDHKNYFNKIMNMGEEM